MQIHKRQKTDQFLNETNSNFVVLACIYKSLLQNLVDFTPNIKAHKL